MSGSVRVTGDDALAAGLAAVGDGLSHLDGAAAAAAHLLAVDARGRAPKRTGTLAASIAGRATGGKATVGAAVRYGLPVHAGVPSRNQSPQPFLFDAVRAQSSELQTAYVTDIQHLIDRSI